MRVSSFPPVIGPGACLLILGSMPGEASLAAGQYYAHPRNAFWPIMGELFGAGPDLPYPERVGRLIRARVALWDVLGSCWREGSLDAQIRDEVPNDLASLFREHPSIRRVALNGGKAAASFRRHAAAFIPVGAELVILPSTSPANARLGPGEKLACWKAALAG